MSREDTMFEQMLGDFLFNEKLEEEDFVELLNNINAISNNGIDRFRDFRNLETLRFLSSSYITAVRIGRKTAGLKVAILSLIKGIYQSRNNYRRLVKGIKITSINKIPENAVTLIYQASASCEFDNECMKLLYSICSADYDTYLNPIGFYHQVNMNENREKVVTLSKKYQKS